MHPSKTLERILLRVQKPARYVGGEYRSVMKDRTKVDLRFAFCFPDTYEIGMSNLGMRILYGVMNEMEGVWCERCFAPWGDMEEELRRAGLPLYALESGDPIRDFDFVGFSLGYEMAYTNVLNMLDLAGIPLHTWERGEGDPIVIAGGTCAYHCEPLADFIDLFSLGEGEDVTREMLELYRLGKREGWTRREYLRRAAQVPGLYVPSLYDVRYHEDGTIAAITPRDGAPAVVTKRIVQDLDQSYYPVQTIVPSTEIVHDRVMLEVFRGCIRGCRFCQAGFIYRPVREKSPQTISRQSRLLCEATGYDELSLCSLSSSDYSRLKELLEELLSWTEPMKINIALPSLRIDNFDRELLEKLSSVRKSGLTFAAEAGTQRLRDVINKNITEEEILRTSRSAFEGGRTAVKLYFMLGLPTETEEDVRGIAALAQKVVDEFYHNPNKPRGKSVQVSVSASNFVPKPFTPFQWEPQATEEELIEKQKLLRESITTRKVQLSCHHPEISALEGVMTRGDRRLGQVIEQAWKNGCRFDSWENHFSAGTWRDSFAQCGISPAFYANRRRAYDEILPWDHLNYGIRKSFLQREAEKAKNAETTPQCRVRCAGCGADSLNGGHCDARRKD